MTDISALIVDYLPSIAMLAAGFVLVVIEIYIPGFGAPGIAGILLLAGGIYFAHPSPLGAVIMALAILALLCIALLTGLHSASTGRLSKSRLVLRDVATQPEPASGKESACCAGREGRTCTALRPVGTAEIDGAKLSVVSDGEYIPAGVNIVVDRVDGSRIVVRANNINS